MEENAVLPALRKFLKSLDYFQLLVMSGLLLCGLIFIRSTGIQVDTPGSLSFFPRQLCWIALGFSAYWILAFIDYRRLSFKAGSLIFYLAILLLLTYVLFFGLKVFGARRWMNLFGFRLQPSEPAKLAVISVLAWIFSARDLKRQLPTTILFSAAVTVLPFLLIVAEPDLGSAAILVPIYFAMLFCAGIKWKYVGIILVASLMIFSIFTVDYLQKKPVLLREYQRKRINVFLNPESSKRDWGHNAYQAKLAVGSGGITGKGIGDGTQNELGFLPQTVSNNDFIFSVIAEETGFVGVMVLLALYCGLLYSILRTAFIADSYGRLLAVGAGTMIFFHIFINIGMSIGLAPITGLPLPLVSYGGSFILTSMVTLGLMQSIYRHTVNDGE